MLSSEESSWLEGLAGGRTVVEPARAAGYSEREMYRRLRRLYAQLGASSRAEALVRATQLGLLENPSGASVEARKAA